MNREQLRVYENGKLKLLAQTGKIFTHPHHVCVDYYESSNVAQRASGKVYPYKFTQA